MVEPTSTYCCGLFSPRKRNRDSSTMPSAVSKVKEKVSEKVEQSVSRSRKRSSGSSSPTSSPNGRVIPPEPVQQRPDGEHSDNENGPAMQVHNLGRANKSVKKLEWDDRLARDAKVYADLLASTGLLEHSGSEAQGENLFVSDNASATFADAVQSWMNEEKNYHGEKIGEGNLDDWSNFTQCLWHSTTHVGMGKATAKNGKTYIVARYSPRGNIHGGKPF